MDWSVATVAPNCEALAAQHLGRAGVATYHPRFRDGRRRDGTPRLSALFPGYLFIHAALSPRPVSTVVEDDVSLRTVGDGAGRLSVGLKEFSWRTVLGTRGVTGVLGISSDGPPQVLGDDVVQGIRALECGDGDERAIVLPEKFRSGARVRVRATVGDARRHTVNPFFGCEGVCQGMGARDRVWVLLRIMGGEVRINFRKADLVLA